MTKLQADQQIEILEANEQIRLSQCSINIANQQHTINVSEQQIIAAKKQIEIFEEQMKEGKSNFEKQKGNILMQVAK
jgi:hypothetical protein